MPAPAAIRTIYCNPDLVSGDDDGTSEANAWQSFADAVDDFNGDGSVAAPLPGSKIYFKKTASRIDEGSVTFETDGDGTGIMTIEGYETTPGDGGTFAYGDQWTIQGKNILVKNIDLEADMASTTGLCRIHNDARFINLYNCKIYNTSTVSNHPAIKIENTVMITNCAIISDQNPHSLSVLRGTVHIGSFDSVTISGCVIRGTHGVGGIPALYGCIIEGNIFCHAPNERMIRGIELDLQVGGSPVRESIIANNTILTDQYGIYFVELQEEEARASLLIKNNLIWGSSGGDGGSLGIYNSCSGPTSDYGAAGYPTVSTTSIFGNAIGNMSGGTVGNIYGFAGFSGATWGRVSPAIANVDLTQDPFVDIDNEDLRLNGVSGGGASCRSSALPTTFPSMSFTNRSSIGAVGHDGLVERVSVG